MVGVRMDARTQQRLFKEQARRILAGYAPSDSTMSGICRDALIEYLNKQEMMA